jgi:hypothetical protein
MSNNDRKEEIKAEITKLIQEYSETVNAERILQEIADTGASLAKVDEPVYVVGWVAFAEFEATSLMAEECTSSISLYQPGQPRSMSRGLHELGVDVYSG